MLRRLGEMAQAGPELRARQPWKVTYERDPSWLSKVVAEHCAGNDTNVGTLMAGFPCRVQGNHRRGLRGEIGCVPAQHAAPDIGRGYLECAYRPMIELLGYLEANGCAHRPPADPRRRQFQRRPPVLEFTYHSNKPYLRRLLLHDDDQREFDHTTGAER